MTNTQVAALSGLVDTLREISDEVFTPLEQLRAQVLSLFAADAARPGRDALSRLDPAIVANLGGPHQLVVGSGFVAAPDVLADQHLWLQWWRQDAGTAPSWLEVDLDPASDRFCDYTQLPWFSVPRQCGRRHVTGPYVDYLCSEEYMLTFTLPVYADGEFEGVVGSDVPVARLEPTVLPQLRRLGRRAALVNAQGRVTVSTTMRQPAGSLVREPAEWLGNGSADAGGVWHRCDPAPFAVLVGDALPS